MDEIVINCDNCHRECEKPAESGCCRWYRDARGRGITEVLLAGLRQHDEEERGIRGVEYFGHRAVDTTKTKWREEER
jgi:hypothetical protein